MDLHKSMLAVLCSIIVIGTTSIVSSSVTYAEEVKSSERKVSMERANPNEPIGRDAVLSKVKSQYPGRILSVQEKPTPNAPDCHVVRMLSADGEYLNIWVACEE